MYLDEDPQDWDDAYQANGRRTNWTSEVRPYGPSKRKTTVKGGRNSASRWGAVIWELADGAIIALIWCSPQLEPPRTHPHLNRIGIRMRADNLKRDSADC